MAPEVRVTVTIGRMLSTDKRVRTRIREVNWPVAPSSPLTCPNTRAITEATGPRSGPGPILGPSADRPADRCEEWRHGQGRGAGHGVRRRGRGQGRRGDG